VRWLTIGLARFTADLTPRLTTSQTRTLCRLAVGLRWIAVCFAGLAGLLAPRVPPLLLPEMLAAIVYNGLVMLLVLRGPDEALPGIALLTTVIDQLLCFSFIGTYNVIPGSQQIAVYVPAMLEATAFFSLMGVILSVGLFLGGILVVQTAGAVFWRGPIDGSGLFGATLLVVLVGACLGGVDRVVMHPVDSAAGEVEEHGSTEEVRLSQREQDVLRLVAQGLSNSMIAGRLGLSERTVKNYVEGLLSQLHARNRAEAVAAASRLRLL
jgi:DNA-binding CsgD family transcriptional regulator